MRITYADALRQLTGPGGEFEIARIDIRGIPTLAYQRFPQTLPELLRQNSARFAERDYLIYRDERYTYAQTLAQVAAIATLLRDDYSIAKGDRVAISMRNYPEFVMFYWAIVSLGAIAVTLNAWWTEDELAYGIENSTPSVLVVDEERLRKVHPITRDAAFVKGIISVRSELELPGVVRFEQLREGFDPAATLPEVEIAPDDDATILYTSGTTGRPKGAVNSHRNHCTNLTNSLVAAAAGQLVNPRPAGSPEPPQGGTPLPMPLFHIAGQSQIYLAMGFGWKLGLMYKWSAEETLDMLEREKMHTFSGIVSMTQALLRLPDITERNLDNLVSLSAGGMVVPPELVKRSNKIFGGRVAFATGYGSSEATSSVAVISGQEYVDFPDSVGAATPVNELRICDSAGNDLPTGEVGELWAKGPNIVRGYWNRPEATAEAFEDGWLKSGDIGRLDDQGRFFLVDRIKDVVIRSGENVYCAEVEAAIYEHPSVRTVAVLGTAHPEWGEEVTAVIWPNACDSLTLETLTGYLDGKLAHFKIPTRLVERTEDLPRTATGKILKRELRDELTTSARTDA